MRILMVCLGNICRSPLAHGILQSKLPSDRFFVDSAGTANYHVGSPPDHRSIATAKKHGLDISMQRCRQFSDSDFEDFDLIFTMDLSNHNNVGRLAKKQTDREKVKLLLSQTNFDIEEVPDPYYGTDSDFEKVFHLLDKACEIIAKELLKN